MKYNNVGYMAYTDTSYTVSVQSYYYPGCGTTSSSVGVSGNSYTTTLYNNNPYTITIYNGTITQNTSGQTGPYTLYKKPITPTAGPSVSYTYVHSGSSETINVIFGYYPTTIYTTSWGTFTNDSLSNLTPYMTYTNTQDSSKGFISYTFTSKYPVSTLNWGQQYCKFIATFSTQHEYSTKSATVTHFVVRKPYIKVTVKYNYTPGYINGEWKAFVALQRTNYQTNFANTSSGNYYSTVLLGGNNGDTVYVPGFATSMADPTYEYIPYITNEKLLNGLVHNRYEDYASNSAIYGFPLASTKTVYVYVPEAIFYNKTDSTVRFLIGVNWTARNTSRTYNVTSNNSNYTINRLTNNYAAKWGFYSNSVTRAQLMSYGTFSFSVTW